MANAGKTGHEALIVTDEDEVFACGTNLCGCLGLENDGPQAEPVKIPELSNKEVKGKSVAHSKKVVSYE